MKEYTLVVAFSTCCFFAVLAQSVAAMTAIKPQSHRIVRFIDRTIGCDWARVQLIGTVCHDHQQRSHTAIDLYAIVLSERLDNIDGKSHRRNSCNWW